MSPVSLTDTIASTDLAMSATLDDLFQHAALRRPDTVALIDPPNRQCFAEGTARHVSYASADRMVEAIAGRLQRLGLPRGSVIALQTPNLAEGVLALLGVLRAGMVAMPLPLLWRRADIVVAMSRVGARAIIAGGRIGGDDLGEVALHAAAEAFSVRYVFGIGARSSDGAIALGELYTVERIDPLTPRGSDENDPALALITWETSAQGHIPVARNHAQLIAGGLAVTLEARLAPDARILTTCMTTSFAGLALSVVPWLLTGGTLALHQAFDAEALVRQFVAGCCDTLVLPGPAVAPFDTADLFAKMQARNVIAWWRSPERLAASAGCQISDASITDIRVFGESGLIARRRDASGAPANFPLGTIAASCDGDGVLVETARTRAGTLALRGPMVPRVAFSDTAAQRDAPIFSADAAGHVDTGYPFRIDPRSGAVVITGPPAGIVDVGGYRFARRGLQDALDAIGPHASLAALPEMHLTHRFAGDARDPAKIRAALTAAGAHALIVGAFVAREKPQAA